MPRGRNKPLHVMLDDDEDRSLRASAKTHGLTLRELVLRAVQAYQPESLKADVEDLQRRVGFLERRRP